MPTKLFLRNTRVSNLSNQIGGIVYDMSTTAGSASDEDVVNTAASGTQIQWTQSAGGATVSWISGRSPAGGFTLTTGTLSVWGRESNTGANAGIRYRVFKYTDTTGSITELGGGPFNSGVELNASATTPNEYTIAGNVSDTSFSENDRIMVIIYITNVGTMGSGRTCTLTFNAADAATGDSFYQIQETVTFKSENGERRFGYLMG